MVLRIPTRAGILPLFLAARYDADDVYEIAGYVGAVIGAGFALLQGRRTLRTDSVEGISVFAWVATACNSALWLNYGLAERSLAQIAANAPWLPMLLILGRALSRHGKIPRYVARFLPPALVVAGYPLVNGQPGIVLVLGVLLGQMTTLVQLVATLQSPSAKGVSLGAWSAITVGSANWVVHGLGTGKTPITVTAALGLIGNIANVAALLVKKRRSVVLHADGSAHGN